MQHHDQAPQSNMSADLQRAVAHLREIAQAYWDRTETHRTDPFADPTSAEIEDASMAWGFEKAAESLLAMPPGPDRHLCGHCDPQTYEGQVELVPPDFLKRDDGRGICVDVCLALEITQLWRAGIKTTGCCCGHGKHDHMSYIGVIPEHIQRMKDLGYVVRPNPMRPGDEDGFVPKTVLS